ncbi:hypothetical protein IAU60_000357 [Kwoniella sp. DSM 27419]
MATLSVPQPVAMARAGSQSSAHSASDSFRELFTGPAPSSTSTPDRTDGGPTPSQSPTMAASATVNGHAVRRPTHSRTNSVKRKPVPALQVDVPIPKHGLGVDALLRPSSAASSSRSKLHDGESSSRTSSPVPNHLQATPGPEARQRTRLSRSPRDADPPVIPPRSVSRSKSQQADPTATSPDEPPVGPGELTAAQQIVMSLGRPLPPLPATASGAAQLSPSGSGDRTPTGYLSSGSNTPPFDHPIRGVSPHGQDGPSSTSVQSPRTGAPAEGSSSSSKSRRSQRSLDLLDVLRATPTLSGRRDSRPSSPAPGPNAGPGRSIPMGQSKSNGLHPRSKIFRWDSTEKAKAKKADPVPADDEETFSVHGLPSKRNLWEAGTCFLKDEEGQLVCFGDFFPRGTENRVRSPSFSGSAGATDKGKARDRLVPGPAHMEKSATYPGPPSISTASIAASYQSSTALKTVVFFIRHFWCGQCQDYTLASLSLLDPVALEKAGIRVVIISNGSWKIIKSYRKLFNCPFPIFVDGPRRLYQLMGMTKMTNDFGPMFKGRAAYHQRAVPGQLLHGLGNAFFKMPLANPGTLTQLGGEFILTPGFNCEFAHRMTTTSDHMEAPDVLRRAGCEAPTRGEVADLELVESQRAEIERLEQEMREWRESRAAELDRIQAKKAARRGVPFVPARRDSDLTTTHLDLDLDVPEPVPPEDILMAKQAELVEMLDNEEGVAATELDEQRAKEKVAAIKMMAASGRGSLKVEVEAGPQ